MTRETAGRTISGNRDDISGEASDDATRALVASEAVVTHAATGTSNEEPVPTHASETSLAVDALATLAGGGRSPEKYLPAGNTDAPPGMTSPALPLAVPMDAVHVCHNTP